MTQILKDRSFRISIILTIVFLGVGVSFLILGIAEYSWVLFGILPVLLGISIGALPNRKWAIFGAVLAALVFLYGLLTVGLSGFLCVLFSIPLILPLIFVGSIITHLIDRHRKIKTDKVPILLLPLIPFMVAAPLERGLSSERMQVIEVKTEHTFDFTPEQVFDAIKSVDTLDAEKSFLMNFDLPVPTKCVLEQEQVGGIRTCYFDGGNLSWYEYGGGTITERITELERGRILRMDVIDYTLVGRDWLGFSEAIYLFEKLGGNKCKMTRVTTYTSELTPRFYWEPLEKLGIQQEHEFVIRNLEEDLREKHSR